MVQRRRRGNHRGSRPSHLRHPKSYKVLCSGCSKEVLIPVPPPDDRKLLCADCFGKRDIAGANL